MSKVVVVYHSGYGHTRVLAEAVTQGVDSQPDSTALLLPVDQVPQHWQQLHSADAIIFGSPTYMGSVSAPFKHFMEATSAFYLARPWRNKLAAGFTNSGNPCGDKFNTLVQMVTFAAQHSMIWVGLDLLPGNNTRMASPQDLNRLGGSLGAMAQSNLDEGSDTAPPEADRLTARHLGERVARLAAQMSMNQSNLSSRLG
ncbi:NADPH-dependent FMN reductase [Pokkaliibacter plantistimulans]|uniref:NADPH-dependent FMN reductase n=1 Tax=Pokkaliibacter plantistimulans TaxID=1635171 RepID=A0ABX5LY45_9GAMM|nr:flavodoxin family protein [Pokkaliibacter plantistimulans]PXF30216.1 NADPH-dependent FMN reductase [Pokkaliibacter plantistimulans]